MHNTTAPRQYSVQERYSKILGIGIYVVTWTFAQCHVVRLSTFAEVFPRTIESLGVSQEIGVG